MKSKRILSAALALVLCLALLPLSAMAASSSQGLKVGDVTVIVSGSDGNNTVDLKQVVELLNTDSVKSCVNKALNEYKDKDTGSKYTSTYDDTTGSYTKIGNIELKTGDTWLCTVDDWVVDRKLDNVKYGSSPLTANAVIRLQYVPAGTDTGAYGAKLEANSPKTLKSLAITGATLYPAFSSGRTEYSLIVPEATTISLTPTATNKYYAVGVFREDITDDEAKTLTKSWYKDATTITHSAYGAIDVKPGDVFSIVVGAPNWDCALNNDTYKAKDVKPVVYTLRVTDKVEKASSAGTTNYYVVHTYVGAGGTVEPDGSVMVRSGSDRTFTITPDAGYEVADVVVNHKSLGAVTSYTFKNIDANQNLEVTFVKTGTAVTTGTAANPATGAAV